MGFSRKEYWSRLPFPSPEDLPEPGVEPRSPVLQADSLPSEPPGRDVNSGYGGSATKSCLTLVTPWTVAHPASLSMKFSRQEYCSGLPFPSPDDLPNPGIKPGSSALQADLPSEPPGKPKDVNSFLLNE